MLSPWFGGDSDKNIASPYLPFPPLDPTRWSNLARAFYDVDTFCVEKVELDL